MNHRYINYFISAIIGGVEGTLLILWGFNTWQAIIMAILIFMGTINCILTKGEEK